MRTYATDLTEAQWALVDSIIPEGKSGGRPRSIDVRAVVNAIFYLLRTGCQWRLLPVTRNVAKVLPAQEE